MWEVKLIVNGVGMYAPMVFWLHIYYFHKLHNFSGHTTDFAAQL
jgi:hypothetical protein